MTELEKALETIQRFATTAEVRRSALIDLLYCNSDRVASECGDTFLYDCQSMAPTQQWAKILCLLDDNGFMIIKKEDVRAI